MAFIISLIGNNSSSLLNKQGAHSQVHLFLIQVVKSAEASPMHNPLPQVAHQVLIHVIPLISAVVDSTLSSSPVWDYIQGMMMQRFSHRISDARLPASAGIPISVGSYQTIDYTFLKLHMVHLGLDQNGILVANVRVH